MQGNKHIKKFKRFLKNVKKFWKVAWRLNFTDAEKKKLRGYLVSKSTWNSQNLVPAKISIFKVVTVLCYYAKFEENVGANLRC